MTFSLVELENKFISNPHNLTKPRPGLYPSEASVRYQVDGKIVTVGECHRASYYRNMNIYKEREINPGLQMKADLGKWDEQGVIDRWKAMGIWVGNNIKFYNPKYYISGELDAVIRDPETNKLIGLECCTPESLILNGDYRFTSFLNTKNIISQDGEKEEILNFQIKQVNNEKIFIFKGKFDGICAEFTKEHPILIGKVQQSRFEKNNKKRSYSLISTEWKKAKDVEKGDYICIPKAKFGLGNLSLDKDLLDKYEWLTKENNWKYKIIDNKIYSFSKNAKQQEKGFPRTITDLKSFYWLIGLYIAEGSCSNNSVYFSLHKEEKEIIDRLQLILKNFNLEGKILKLKDTRTKLPSKGINFVVTSKAFRELIKSIVPGNSKEKTKYIKYDKINEEYLIDILQGIFEGDGCKVSKYQYRISTSVNHLAFFYFQIIAKIGLHPSLKKHKQQSRFNSEYIYIVEWACGGLKNNIEKLVNSENFWCYKVKKIENKIYTGNVYNLECNKNTYTIGCIITHNCKSYYGYNAVKEVCGSKRPLMCGKPKENQFLQAVYYSWEYRDQLDEYRMYYIERGDGHRVEFRVGTEQLSNGTHQCYWQQLPGPYWNMFSEEKVYRPYTIEDILGRYTLLISYIKNKQLPPRDYERIITDPEVVEWMYNNDLLGKTKFEAWTKNPKKNPITSWQCGYCNFSKTCQQDSITEQE